MHKKLANNVIDTVYKVADSNLKSHLAYGGGGALLGGLGGMLLADRSGSDRTLSTLAGAVAGGLGGVGLSANKETLGKLVDPLFKKSPYNNPATAALGAAALGLSAGGAHEALSMPGHRVSKDSLSEGIDANRRAAAGDNYKSDLDKRITGARKQIDNLVESVNDRVDQARLRRVASSPHAQFITVGANIRHLADEIIRQRELADATPESLVDRRLNHILDYYKNQAFGTTGPSPLSPPGRIRAIVASLLGNSQEVVLHDIISRASDIPTSRLPNSPVSIDQNKLREALLKPSVDARAKLIPRLGRWGILGGIVGGGAALGENALRSLFS